MDLEWVGVYGLLDAGVLYGAGQTLTATALVGAQFVLFNPGLNRVLWVVKADISAAAAMKVDLFRVAADPGLAAGNTPTPLNPDKSANATAQFEAAAAAQPTTAGQWGATQLAAGVSVSALEKGPIRLAAFTGLLVSSAAVAGDVSLSLVWAELVE